MRNILWYLTLSSSIWITYFGSISTSLGDVYFFPILVLLNFIILIFKRKIVVNQNIKFTLVLFFLMIIYGLLSLLWVIDVNMGIKKLTHYLIGLMFLFQFLIIVNNREILKKSISIFSLNYYLVLLVGLIETLSGIYIHSTHYIQTNNLNSLGYHFPMVMTNNTNDFAVFLFLFFPLVLFNLTRVKKYKNLLIFIIYCLITFLIFNTESRLGSFFIILYGFLFIPYSLLYKLKNKGLKVSMLLLLTLLSLIILIFNIPILTDIFYSIKNDPRITLINIAWGSFSDTYGLGLGIGSLFNVTSINIHNYVLEIFFEFGLMVFTFFFLWLIYIFYKLNKVYYESFNVKLLLFYFKLNIILIPFWGGISSTITSNPFIWIFYAFIVAFLNVLTLKKRGDFIA